MSRIHIFEHKAMKTTFKIRLQHENESEARRAAYAAFEFIDEIENTLSRYIPGSDVWQINHLESGQTLFISELCHECLRLSLEAYQATEGWFDVTLGRLIEHQKSKADGPLPQVSGQLSIVPDRPAIYCVEAGREIDFGGIGKGFALDRAKQFLEEWDIRSGILSAGASTHLAFGQLEWTVGLTAKAETRDITLKNQALSASGTGIQGEHILSSNGVTESLHPRVWVLHESAAWSDVWSTAAMLMELAELRTSAPQMGRLYIESAEGRIEEISPATNEA